MIEDEVKAPVLVPYKCPICGKIVAWTLSRAKCRCPVCKKWFAYSEAAVSAGA